MDANSPNPSFFVRVECSAHSLHRDPQGVYAVEVLEDETLLHQACAALEIVRECAPFMSENLDKTILRVFSHDGQEISIPKTLSARHDIVGAFLGRSLEYPDSITMQ